MNYELKIQKNDKWVKLDLMEAVAINYVMNTLTDIKDRAATYSQSIKLPRNSNNSVALGFSDEFAVRSSVPYRVFPCRLFCDGVDLLGKDYLFKLNRISEYFEGQIFSAVKDFFSELSEKRVSDLDLGIIHWTVEDISNPEETRLPHRYFINRVESGMLGLKNFVTGQGVDIKNDIPQMMVNPCYKFIDLVRVILEDNGYSLETDLFDLEGYYDDYLSLASMKPYRESFINNNARAVGKFELTDDEANYPVYNRFENIESFGYGAVYLFTPSWGTGQRGIKYFSMLGCKLNVHVRITVNADNNRYDSHVRVCTASLWVDKSQDEESTVAEWEDVVYQTGAGVSEDYFVDIDLPPMTYVIVYASLDYPEPSSSPKDVTAVVDFTVSQENENVILGSSLKIAPNIGFSTQSEVLKTFLQLYCLNVEIDRVNKVFKVYSFQKLYDNKSRAYNWSEKIDERERNRKLTFRTEGFARVNRFLMQENQSNQTENNDGDIVNVTDIGVLNIDNDTLDPQKDLITFPFEAGKDIETRLYLSSSEDDKFNVANLPIYSTKRVIRPLTIEDENGNINIKEYTEFSFNETKQHLLKESDITLEKVRVWYGLTRNFSYDISPGLKSFNLVLHSTAQEHLDIYYRYLINILANAKSIEIPVLLNSLDIYNLDLTRPVYIQKYGQYFYILKINNYMEGSPTRVELIKM